MAFNRAYTRAFANLESSPTESGILGYWDSENFSNSSLPDASPNGNDADFVGTPIFQTDYFRPSLLLDGTSFELTVSHTAALTITTAITISAWVKLTDITGFRAILSKGDGPTTQNYYLRIDDGKVEFYFRDSGDTANIQYQTTDDPIVANQVYHVVLRHTFGDGSDAAIYINGVEYAGTWNATGDEAPYTNTDDVYIGSRTIAHHFAGNLYKVQLFNELKSPTWITAEYLLGQAALFRADWGAVLSAAPSSACLENTPCRVISPAAYEVIQDTVDTVSSKVLQCTTAGQLYLPSGFFSPSYVQNGYGRFRFWFYKAANATTLAVKIISTDSTGTTGYAMTFTDAGVISLIEIGVGTLFATAAAYFSTGQWYEVLVSRHHLGQFTAYLTSTLIDPSGGSGTNPVTDNTTQTSEYLLVDAGVGDRISWSDRYGNRSLTKYILP